MTDSYHDRRLARKLEDEKFREGFEQTKADLMREFDTGATRDSDADKLDYDGFLSPVVLRLFAEYMHNHRHTENGIRSSDNWQQGMPLDVYMKSLLRHVMELWELHRTAERGGPEFIEVLCAILFNVQGYLFEYEKAYG